MKILSRGTCLALALALLIVGFASPLPAANQTVPQSPDGAAAVPKPPAVKEAAPDGAGSASLRIPGGAFNPRSSDIRFSSAPGGGVYVWDWASVDKLAAPVYLPQGAVVTSVRMYYNDTNVTYDITLAFNVYDFATQTSPYSWTCSSSGAAGLGYADTAAINHTIDFSKYGYLLEWLPSIRASNLQLVGVQIFYTPPPGRAAVIPLY